MYTIRGQPVECRICGTCITYKTDNLEDGLTCYGCNPQGKNFFKFYLTGRPEWLQAESFMELFDLERKVLD
jgi:hypothetical protein